ncbi:MAG: DUF3995 domain-containing protein [Saprospiraceae bacterium]
MTTTLVTGFVVSIIFTFLSLVHFYWAFSGNMMHEYVIPEINNEKLFSPSKLMTIAVGLGLLSFAFIILGHIGVFELLFLNNIFRYGTWLIALVFFARAIGDFKYVGFFKKIKDTKFAFWDTRIYAPLSLLISILIILVIYNNHTP